MQSARMFQRALIACHKAFIDPRIIAHSQKNIIDGHTTRIIGQIDAAILALNSCDNAGVFQVENDFCRKGT